MSAADLAQIVLTAGTCAAAVALIGAAAVWILRRRSVMLSLVVVAATAVCAMVAGAVGVAKAMFLSGHDLDVILTVCLAAGIAALAVAVVLGRSVVRGSRMLTEATRTLRDSGGFTAPPYAPTAELATLGRELATTMSRLAESRERERALESSQRELIAWISHDLRTPLAGLRAMAEALEDGISPDPGRYHRQIRTEVDRLSGMVDDLLELSRIHAGSLRLQLARVSLYDLVSDALAGVDPVARERGVWLDGRGVEPFPVRVDGHEMTRVLSNLLINAVRRTPADGTVAIATRRDQNAVVLTVTDGCGGIPEHHLPRVFDTGWRGSDARTPATGVGAGGGAGLGLAIVRGIVEAHHGRASVMNVPGGCCFEIMLPA
jgi:signal transduction histidine kinase